MSSKNVLSMNMNTTSNELGFMWPHSDGNFAERGFASESFLRILAVLLRKKL